MPPHSDNHISPDDLRRLADLSRIHLSDDKAAAMLASLSSILTHITILQAADLSSAEPLITPTDALAAPAPDTPGPTLPQSTITQLTPHHAGPYITIPKVLDAGEGA